MGTARAAAAAVLVLAVPALAACGGGDDDEALPAFTGATSSTGSPTTSTTSAPTATATGSEAPGVEIKVTVPSSLTGQAKAAAEAYGAYWTFVGASLEKPPVDVSKAGEFAAGDALSSIVLLAKQRAADKITTQGSADLAVSTSTVAGNRATVCARLQDLTATYKNGKVLSPPDGANQTFKATLELEGPSWRTYSSTEVKSC